MEICGSFSPDNYTVLPTEKTWWGIIDEGVSDIVHFADRKLTNVGCF